MTTLSEAIMLLTEPVGPIPLRACAQCEADLGVLDRGDSRKSHGLCRRHTIEWGRNGGLSWEQIEEIVQRVEAGQGWPPDLGAAPRETTRSTVLAGLSAGHERSTGAALVSTKEGE